MFGWRTLLCALCIGVLGEAALAHGGGHRRNRPPPPPADPPSDQPPEVPPPRTPMRPPTGIVPPGYRKPKDPDPPKGPTTPGAKPAKPSTGGDDKPAAPPTPPTPPPMAPPSGDDSQAPKPVPGQNNRPKPKARSRPGRATGDLTSWRIWWEYNREYMVGLRGLMREAGTISGATKANADGKHDPMKGRRDEVRAVLRDLITAPSTRPKLRQACLISLGRLGTEKDVDYFMARLRDKNETDAVQIAAALGLGMLPPMPNEDIRKYVREHLDYVVGHGGGRSRRVRSFAMLAAGLRARTDKVMAMSLARHCVTYIKDGYDAGTLAYACGVSGDPMLLPELMYAARRGVMGGVNLGDAGRSHAAAGLGFIRSPLAVNTLLLLLKSRRAGVHSRRSAVLSLGRLLRETELEEDLLKRVRKDLLKAFRKDRDAILRAFAAIALAGAREPTGLDDLQRVVERTGAPIVKPFAALGLGLAARRVDADRAKKIRSFLLARLDKDKDIELSSALTLALGLAGATEATDLLLERIEDSGLPAPVRSSAAEAVGLLRKSDMRIGEVLLKALRHGPPQLVEGASIALGMIGRRSTARELAMRLESANSGILQGHLTLALGHLGQSTAVDPLLKILKDRKQKRVTRDLAAVALGLLGDPREEDVLFELDSYFNYFATTLLTNELLQIF